MTYLIVTDGRGSLDIYSQNLAMYVKANIVKTDIYKQIASEFNISWFSIKSVSAMIRDFRFLRMLKGLEGVIHLPNHHLGRYGYFLNRPFIITVHDLIRLFDLRSSGNNVFIHKPSARDRYYLGLDYKGIRRATRIIAVSNYTKNDLMKHLGIPESRIRVVYEGVDHSVFKPVKRVPPISNPYLLFVGSEHPRKNIATLLRAFKMLKSSFKELKLVKVGRPGGRESNFREQTLRIIEELGLEGEVLFIDYVSSEQLASYYSHAECYVLPSLYEGFGLTVLEAMACGCPVIASNVTSMPEVAGDAAILVDPKNVEELSKWIRLLLRSEGLRDELREKGIERAKQFSWERTGEETTRIYKEVEEEVSRG